MGPGEHWSWALREARAGDITQLVECLLAGMKPYVQSLAMHKQGIVVNMPREIPALGKLGRRIRSLRLSSAT